MINYKILKNYKIYIGGKFVRELNEKEKAQLNEYAKQVAAANILATPTFNVIYIKN